MNRGVLFAAADPRAARLATALAWLWRLGPLLRSPRSGAIAFGGQGDDAELSRLVGEGRLAGAVIFIEAATAPPRDTGDGLLRVGADPDAEWGLLGFHRILEPIAGYMIERLDRPLVLLPQIGMLRIDDLPGTAQHQLEGRAKGDLRQSRRLRRYVRACRRAGAILNVAVPAQAFDEGRRVPLDRVWPKSIAALRRGVVEGAVEAVGHGLLHLDTERLEHGVVEFREFADLGEEEAGRRIDAARAWQEKAIGASNTFVAPAWAYSEGSLAAAARRGLPCFTRCQAGQLYSPGLISETLKGGLGISGFDYRPLAALAALGLPPTLVLHGTMIDGRAGGFDLPRELTTALRLFLRRDLSRLPGVEGLSWVGASDFALTLARHDEVVVEEGEVRVPSGSRLRIRDSFGERAVES
ncbi:MAG: hypothetical protein ACXWZM_03000 [Solirubrobacterales bacterium]